MSFEAIRCPYCGVEGHIEKKGELWHCSYCNNSCVEDTLEKAYARVHERIGAELKGAVDEAFLRAKEEEYYNLRSLLWEKVHAKYTDSQGIISVCNDIKKLEPHDFLADFFEIANSGTVDDVTRFINNISVSENGMFIDTVIYFMLKSLTYEYVMPLGYLIERAYKKNNLPMFEEYSTKLEAEAEKVSSGIYSTLLPRDVFIAYSSKDIDKVMELMSLLESNGLSCFVAMRNLQHGRDAVANYSNALREAIDNSKIVVFVSSKNSRNFSCDALKEELKYIRESELKSAPAEYRNDYAKLPYKYKKMRVEYRLDDTPTPVDRIVGEFFANLDYCESCEKVLARIIEYSFYGMEEEAQAPATVVKSEDKSYFYCKSCGAKNNAGTKFCSECGSNELINRNVKYCVNCASVNTLKTKFCTSCGDNKFVFTDEEIRKIKAAKEEAERKAREEAERKAREEAERKAKEEAERKAREEAERKAREEAERKAREEAERKDKEDAECKAKEETIRRIKSQCEINGTTLVKYNGDESDIILFEDITEIGDNAFGYCKSITSVVIPDGVTRIGNYAFSECTNLTNIVIPNSVVEICTYVFHGCTKLSGITISNSVKEIGYGVFWRCNSLKSIIVDDKNNDFKVIDGNLYSKDGEILIQYAIGKDSKSFTIPNGVTEIGYSAFNNCTNLTSITIPDSVTKIDVAAFSGCKNLKSIVIPNSVNYVGYLAFEDCPNLTIYCKAKKPLLGSPKGWGRSWHDRHTKVEWNYVGV